MGVEYGPRTLTKTAMERVLPWHLYQPTDATVRTVHHEEFNTGLASGVAEYCISSVIPREISAWQKNRQKRQHMLTEHGLNQKHIISETDALAIVFPALDTPDGTKLGHAILDGFRNMLPSKKRALFGHGGEVARLALYPEAIHNDESVLRTLIRTRNNPLLTYPGKSDLPHYEQLAHEVVTRMLEANMDLYAQIHPLVLPSAKYAIAESIESALSGSYTIQRIRLSDGTIRLTVPYHPNLFNVTRHVIGTRRTTKHDGYQIVSDFSFNPKDTPAFVFIDIGTIKPQGNEQWQLLRARVSAADDRGKTLNSLSIFFNPEPTSHELRVQDNRNGIVNNRQRLSNVWLPDGRVIVPPRKRYYHRQPRVPAEYFTGEKKAGQAAVELSRMIRYLTTAAVFADWQKLGRAAHIPATMPHTTQDMRKLAEYLLWKRISGDRWGHDKEIELSADFVPAIHHGGELPFYLLRRILPRDLGASLMPHLPRAMELMQPRGSWVRQGSAMAYYDDLGQIYWSSGIPSILSSTRFYNEKIRREWPPDYHREPPAWEGLCNASPMAQILRWTHLFSES